MSKTTDKDWRPAGTAAQPARYSDEVRSEAVRRVIELGESAVLVAYDMGVSQGSVHNWVSSVRNPNGKPSRATRVYTAEERSHALERCAAVGVSAAAKELGIGEWNFYFWAKAAGTPIAGKRGVRPPAEADKALVWVRDEYPSLEEWRGLAERWILEKNTAIRQRLLAVRKFLKDYLIGQIEVRGISVHPSKILSRSTLLPSFHATCLAKLAPIVGKSENNYVSEFLDWVLLTSFSIPDDHGRPVVSSEYHNPVPFLERDGSRHHSESVRSPLPYGFIDDLAPEKRTP